MAIAEVGLLDQVKNCSKGIDEIHNKLRGQMAPKRRMMLQNKIKQLAMLRRNSLNCL